jgi:hypothetical protein
MNKTYEDCDKRQSITKKKLAIKSLLFSSLCKTLFYVIFYFMNRGKLGVCGSEVKLKKISLFFMSFMTLKES